MSAEKVLRQRAVRAKVAKDLRNQAQIRKLQEAWPQIASEASLALKRLEAKGWPGGEMKKIQGWRGREIAMWGICSAELRENVYGYIRYLGADGMIYMGATGSVYESLYRPIRPARFIKEAASSPLYLLPSAVTESYNILNGLRSLGR